MIILIESSVQRFKTQKRKSSKVDCGLGVLRQKLLDYLENKSRLNAICTT